mgnify:CR=1 FL=1
MWNDLARHIIRRRQERGWSQRELARRAGIAVSTLNDLESGQAKDARLSTLARIAAALMTPVGSLFSVPEP